MIWMALISILAAEEETYRWPLDLPRELTSSFGEFREGRFHAGIDLRTGGIGKPVYASLDGHVSRLRCSPWGYGKAVYLRLVDGNSIVYAHLDGFAGPLAERVRRVQHEQRSYTVDFDVPPDAIPVKRGQLIAFSGQTGVGAPHLHYEIRDTFERPMNPRLVGLTWPDPVAPTIRRVAIVPHGPDSTVEGDLLPVIREARRVEPGRYVCDPVSASGMIGFAVDLEDRGASGAYRLGVRRVHTAFDDGSIFLWIQDYLDYANLHNGAVAYHPFLRDLGRFLVLWRWEGNNTSAYSYSAAHHHSSFEGWWNAAGGKTVKIGVVDFAGNGAVVEIPIRAEKPEPTSPVPGSTGRGTASIECVGTHLVVTASFSEPEPELPGLISPDPMLQPLGWFRRIDDRTFRAAYAPMAPGRIRVQVKHPRIDSFERTIDVFMRRYQESPADLDGVRITVHKESPYGTLFTWREDPPNDVQSILPRRGPVFAIGPEDSPIDQPVLLSFPAPEGAERPERVAIYRYAGGGWSHQDSKTVGGRLEIESRRLGVFAALEDDRAPEAGPLRVGDGKSAIATPRPPVSAAARDAGSGIAEWELTLDGRWLLSAYDPEADLIHWERDEDLPSGEHELRLRVRDNAGNETSVTRRVRVP